MSDANSEPNDVTVHNKETPGRIEADAKDQQTIDKLEFGIVPMNSDDHPSFLLNIVSGMLATDLFNVDEAAAFGTRQWKDYKERLPDEFYSAINKVVTMAVNKKNLKLGTHFSFDAEFIYSCGLIPSRKLDPTDLFRYELSPVPTSIFADNGDMRITKSTYMLKQKLQVSHSTRTSQLQMVIIDENAILWVINWQVNGNVQDL